MAVFKVERNTGYSVMSNHYLCNQSCSISIGKRSTQPAPRYGSLKKRDISSGGKDEMKKAK